VTATDAGAGASDSGADPLFDESNPSFQNLATHPPEWADTLARERLERARDRERIDETRATTRAEDAAFDAALDLAVAPWPTPLGEAAFYGMAGEHVECIARNSEADPAALLTQELVAFGAVVGDGPYYEVEADRHPARLFAVVVGETANARKGTSAGIVRRRYERAQRPVTMKSGLSSGEGLIWCVRDPITKRDRNKRTGEIEEHLADDGVEDKRLLVVEGEFSHALRVVGREHNTLAAVIREAWDRGALSTLTKNSPAKATGAHLCIIGHITPEELRRDLDRTDAASGFGNRFLWVGAKRSKLLPDGGSLDESSLGQMADELAQAVDAAKARPGPWRRDEAARELWHAVYPGLSGGRPGLLGAVTSRAPAQVTRLGLAYALLDAHRTGSDARLIERPHLEAALEVWRYCFDSARHIFGDAIGDPKADEALAHIRAAGRQGITRTDLGTALFGRQNVSRERLARALRPLLDYRLAQRGRTPGNGAGRPPEVWIATGITPSIPFVPFSSLTERLTDRERVKGV